MTEISINATFVHPVIRASIVQPTIAASFSGFVPVPGPQGPAGADGNDGADGLNGADGAQGATGPQGPQGLTGPTGPQGPAGNDGAQGLQGDPGPQGPQGPAGADGDSMFELFAELGYDNAAQPVSDLDIIPATTDNRDLGRDLRRWKRVYLSEGIVVPAPNGSTWLLTPTNVGGSLWTQLTAPSSLPSAGMLGWFDVSNTGSIFQNENGTGVVADGDVCGRVNDQSAAANNITQALSGNKPVWRENRINGLPSITFDGVDDFLSCAFAGAIPQTVYIVLKSPATGGNQTIFDGLTLNSRRVYSDGTNFNVYSNNPGASKVYATNTWMLVKFTFASSGSSVTINGGIPTTSGTAMIGSPDGFVIGANASGSAPASIEAAEWWIYDHTPDVTDDGICTSYALSKYGL